MKNIRCENEPLLQADLDPFPSMAASQIGIDITRAPPGPMKMAPDETGEHETMASIEDPDGYRNELIQAR